MFHSCSMWSDSIARIKVSRTKPSDNVRLISNSIEWNAQKRFKYSVRIVFSLKITVSKTTQPLTWYTVLKGSVIDLSIQLEFKMRCLKLKCTSDLNVSIETISWSVNGKNLLQIDSILYKLWRMFVGIQGDSTFSIEEFDLTNKKTRFRTLKRKETFFDM